MLDSSKLSRERTRWLLGVGLAFAAAVGLACGSSIPTPTPDPVTGMSTLADTTCFRLLDHSSPDSAMRQRARECVDSADARHRSDAISHVRPAIRRLAELHWTIPEYHDEQRLAAGDGTLGPKAFIYATPYLGGFTDSSDVREHGDRGILAAVVLIERDNALALPQTYQKLHLRPGVNCLWLALVTVAAAPAAQWRASITFSADSSCTRQPMPTPATDTLEVRSTNLPPFPANEFYPPVARFHDSQTEQPLFGVRCLTAWCVIGPNGWMPRAPLAASITPAVLAASEATWGSPTVPPLSDVERTIEGWHDEQRLALRSGTTFRGSIRAAIVPVAGLDKLRLRDFVSWTTVAYIMVPDVPPAKYQVWLRQGLNKIELRKLPAGAWEGRVFMAGLPTPKPMRVKPHPHFDAPIPGTARFRWTIGDDLVWVSCGQACCEVYPS